MRAKLARFMIGRNGSDDLSRFVAVVTGVMILASMFLGRGVSAVLRFFIVAGVIYCYFRIFSRNYKKRREENMRYVQIKNELLSGFRGARERYLQRRDYKFFRCPACRTMLRVPRGKGKIKVVCRKCGTSFIKKT